MIIEFLLNNYMLLFDVYFIGFFISMIVNTIIAGTEGDYRIKSVFYDSLLWFIEVLYVIGLLIGNLTNKGKK